MLNLVKQPRYHCITDESAVCSSVMQQSLDAETVNDVRHTDRMGLLLVTNHSNRSVDAIISIFLSFFFVSFCEILNPNLLCCVHQSVTVRQKVFRCRKNLM